MVAADDDQGVVGEARLVEFIQQHPDGGIPGGDLPEVVGEVLADFGHIGQKGGQLALEGVGVDAPEGLAAALDPLAVDVGRAEPVTERRCVRPRGEQVAEVAADSLKNFLFGRLAGPTGGHHLRHLLRELIDPAAVSLEAVLLGIGRVDRPAGAPDLVGVAEKIAGVAKQRRKARNRVIVDGANQN